MRYTRYNYKKKNGWGFLLWLLLIIMLALAIGVTIFKMFFNDKNVEDSLSIFNQDNKQQEVVTEENSSVFKIIQCGLFTKEENAKETLNTLPSSMTGFIVQDEGKFKVMAGIYSDEDSAKKVEDLTNVSISSFGIKCAIPKTSADNKVEVQIIEGLLQIVNKFEESNVKSVKTSEFKKWTEETVSNVKNNSEELGGLIKFINELPDEYTKKNVQESKEFLYKLLIKYRVK